MKNPTCHRSGRGVRNTGPYLEKILDRLLHKYLENNVDQVLSGKCCYILYFWVYHMNITVLCMVNSPYIPIHVPHIIKPTY